MTESTPWTLDRVSQEVPALAPLARLHMAVEAALARLEQTTGSLHPAFPGAPAVHWIEGIPLLDAALAHDAATTHALARAVPALVQAAATAVVSVVPSTAAAVTNIQSATQSGAFAWGPRLARFREDDATADVPEPELFRFLLLRALSVPARHLGRSISAPHRDRWKRALCPFCGVPPAACVARAGSGRTLLCVLCGGRWENPETVCSGCGERSLDKFRVLASREAGPATLESCTACGTTLKVFSSPDLVWGPPLAMEVLTVRLDLLAGRDEGVRRPEIAVAALYPP